MKKRYLDGHEIQKRRKMQKMEISDLARLARVGKTTIRNIEDGKRTANIEVVNKLAEALDCDFYDIMT